MKHTIKLLTLVALISTFSVGCAVTQGLPSLTLGGAANKTSILGAKCNKKELAVTAPLVDLHIPWPNLKVEE